MFISGLSPGKGLTMARRKSFAGGFAAMSLAWNVPQVMALRLAKIGRGGKRGKAESSLMVSEKLAAAVEAQEHDGARPDVRFARERRSGHHPHV